MSMAKGDGYLRKKGNTWYFEFMYKYKRYYEKIGNVSKTVAKEIANEIRSQIIRGEYIPQRERRTTFKEAAKRYLEWYKTKSSARELSVRKHESRVKVLIDYFGDMLLTRISYFTIESYKKKRLERVSKETVNKELRVLKSIFNRAKELGLFSENIPKVEQFKDTQKEEVRYLTKEEAQRLIDACPEWFKPVVIFALNTGLRAGEIFSLTWDMVDFKNRQVYIQASHTKTKKLYKIPLNETAYNLLRRLAEKRYPHGYVFVNSKGEPYSVDGQGYRGVFKRACKRAGIENFRFHDLRHTFASWVAMQSKDIYAVQRLLNHSDLSMTKRYAHLTDDYLHSVVNAVNFGNISEKEK